MYSKIHLTQCNEFGQSRRQTCLSPQNSLVLTPPESKPPASGHWAVLCPCVLPFSGCHINGIIQNITFWSWLFPFSIMPSDFLCVGIFPFILWAASHCPGGTLLSSTPEGHLVVPLSGPLWTKLLLNICVQVLCEHKFSFLLGVYLGMGLQDHRISVCLTL